MQSDFFSKTILADVETGSKESNAGVQVSYGGGCGPWQNRGHQEQSRDGYLLKVSLAKGGTDLEFNVEMFTLESSAQKLA